MLSSISVSDLAARLTHADNTDAQPALVLLDVRETWEFDTCHLDGALSIPMQSIPARLSELDPAAQIVCICHHGVRSLQIAHFLIAAGFSSVSNLTGGIDAWARQIDPTMAVY